MHPVWKLQAFDRAGNVIGTISKLPEQSIVFEGSSEAFALVMPDLRKVPAFFTDPEALGRAAFEAYTAARPESPWSFKTWEEITASDPADAFKARWIAAAQAAIAAPAA